MKIFIFLLITLTSLSAMSDVNWIINKDHSVVNFKVKYLKIADIEGRFLKFNGMIKFSQDNPRKINKININIQSKSIFTGNKLRDGHLKKSDFLHVDKFKYISFSSDHITHLNLNNYLAEGFLNIKDIRKKITISFHLSELQKDTWNYENLFVNFKASINRHDFHIIWNKTLDGHEFLIDDLISIDGTIQMQPDGSKTPPSKHMIPDNPSIRVREKFYRGELKDDLFSKTNIVKVKNSQNPIPLKKFVENTKSAPQDEKTISQQHFSSLVYVGFLGFLAIVYLCIHFKIWLAKKYGTTYKEIGVLGISSDLVCMFFVYLFAVSFYNLGWG
jgi:polyisoprenoid-binding protein YceI